MGLNISEVVSEFGAYAITKSTDIYGHIFKDTKLESLMTNVPGVQGSYQMTSATLGEVLQPYQNAWTPKGTLKFIPKTYTLAKVKFDIDFNPHDIHHKWLGFLAQEGIEEAEWPITRYYIEMHLVPRILRDRAKICADGVKAAVTSGTAGDAVDAQDGIYHLLGDAITATTISPVAIGAITSSNALAQVKAFIKGVPKEVLRESAGIICSYDILEFVRDDYFDTFDGKELQGNDMDGYLVPGTQVRLIPVDEFDGKTTLMVAPSDHLLKMYDQVSDANQPIQVQQVDRNVKIFGDFSIAWGWAVDEYVYVNDNYDSAV